jgi:hypothetical protein
MTEAQWHAFEEAHPEVWLSPYPREEWGPCEELEKSRAITPDELWAEVLAWTLSGPTIPNPWWRDIPF